MIRSFSLILFSAGLLAASAADAGKVEQDVKETDIVMPGDIIRVTERFF